MPKSKLSQLPAEAKSKFLADMSKEIQNSMKIIISRCELLRQTDPTHQQTEYVDIIYESALKLSWIVNDILDFSQMEMGKVKLQSVDFNLEYLINDLFKKTVKKKKDNPVDTYIDIANDVPVDLIGDPTRLRQVLANLLSNSFKYTRSGEIGIIVRCDQTDVKDGEVNLKIIVKDSGQGIADDQMDSIFELQSQGDPSKAWEFGGTGLGLAICKLIIDTMGGTIEAKSKEGVGSAFEINLAFKLGTKLRDKNVRPLDKKELVGKNAIIVDDNEIARKVLKKCCESLGIQTMLISASPRAVLQMLSELSMDGETPDLLLCDIMMPEMDGYELIKKIRSEPRFGNMKAIAVTSAVQVGSAQNAEDCGFNGFLPKPVFLDELAKVITTVLGDKRKHKTIVTRHMAEEISYQETKIISITDDNSDRKVLEDCLEMLECQREFVKSSQEAVDILSDRLFDVCLLDFDVLKREGADMIRVIKDMGSEIPVVVLLSSVNEKEQRSFSLEAGVDDFLIKPVDGVGIKRIIKRYGRS